MSAVFQRYREMIDRGLTSVEAVDQLAREIGIDAGAAMRSLTRADKQWRQYEPHSGRQQSSSPCG